MDKKSFQVELFKYAEGNLNYRHFNTVFASHYEQLLDRSTDPFAKENNDKKPIAFYSPQLKTFVTSQEHFDLWLKKLKNWPVIYLYCIIENDPIFTDATIKENLDEKFEIDSWRLSKYARENADSICFLCKIYNFMFD